MNSDMTLQTLPVITVSDMANSWKLIPCNIRFTVVAPNSLLAMQCIVMRLFSSAEQAVRMLLQPDR